MWAHRWMAPTDSAALADLIRELIADPALRNRLGEAAAKTERQYTWERNAAQMRELFDKALRQSSRL